MLILDDREDVKKRLAGKTDTVEHELRRLGVGDDRLTVMRLESADLVFAGNGPVGECVVGCERKKLDDLITSMIDRRLSKQLREMSKSYDFLYLFCEGSWRPGHGGEIEEYRGGEWRPYYSHGRGNGRKAVMYDQLTSFLDSLSINVRNRQNESLRIKRTFSARETARQYLSLYEWFQRPWHSHHSHDQVYVPAPKIGLAGGRVGTTTPEPLTAAWRAAAVLEGLDRKALAASKFFGTFQNIGNATVKEWERLPGVGPTLARKLVEQCQKEGK